ncbi:MAG: hypothetical protein KDA53_04825 [Hyphomonas sp.]|nr:hypothetical protein [Hyphomonas sp.]
MMISLALALSGLVFASPSTSQGLVTEQVVERMVVTESEDGSTELELLPAETAEPGEELIYSLHFETEGETAEQAVVLTVPVPPEVTYVEDSATTSAATVDFSTDGGVSFAPRSDLKIVSDMGERAAEPWEITHVRWTFPAGLAPGAAGTLEFRVVLN